MSIPEILGKEQEFPEIGPLPFFDLYGHLGTVMLSVGV